MRNFKILVRKQGTSEWSTLDMYGATDVNVILNIKDIREPQSIKANYTKSFDIPSTHTNDVFFAGISEQGFYPTSFNPNKKVEAQLMMDDQLMISGYIQLNSVSKEDKERSYNITIFGEVANLFTILGEAELRDLNLTNYNHKWTQDNIKNSWDTSIIRNNTSIPYLKGRGYVYPYEWRGQSDVSIMNVEDFLPSIYIKELVDKSFAKAGIFYQSDFLNGSFFKSLILNYNKTHIYLSEEQKKEREFSANVTSDVKLFVMYPTVAKSSGNYTIPFDNEISDPSNLFVVKYFTPKNKQFSSLGGTVKLKVKYIPTVSPSSPWLITGPNMTCNVWLYDFTASKPIASDIVEFIHNTGANLGPSIVEGECFIDYTGILEANHKYGIIVNFTVPAGPNASKFVTSLGQAVGGTIECYLAKDTEFINAIQQNWLYEGDEIDFTQILPDKVKIKDFLTSISKMFNLYWLPIKDNLFKIEPRDVLYNSGSITDWTGKLDNNDTVTIVPMAELNDKSYKFTYTEDTDFYNENYTGEFDDIYGEKTIEIDNDFVTDENLTQVIFAPSPLTVREGDQTKVMNGYVKYIDGFFEAFEGKPRISIWGGLKSCDAWDFKSSEKTIKLTKYPYAGHLDDPYNPTVDIMWTGCKTYFYKWFKTVPNNLFNTYWRNWSYDIVSKDSHILTATVHLRTNDIINLSLLDTIQLNQVYYKINTIKYNPLTELADIELFKASSYGFKPLAALPQSAPGKEKQGWWRPDIWHEPIEWWSGYGFPRPPYERDWNTWVSFEETTTYLPQRGISYWDTLDNNDLGFRQPSYNANSFGFDNTFRDFNNNFYDRGSFVQISGKDNFVNTGALNIGIRGDKNRVSKRTKNVTITGNNNFVEAGVKNITVVGDNQYIVRSDVSYINGAVYDNNGLSKSDIDLIRGGINEVQNSFVNPTLPNYIKGSQNAVINKGGVVDINYIRSNNNGFGFTDNQ